MERQGGKCGGKEAFSFLSCCSLAVGKLFKFSGASVSSSQKWGCPYLSQGCSKNRTGSSIKAPNIEPDAEKLHIKWMLLFLLLLLNMGLLFFIELYLFGVRQEVHTWIRQRSIDNNHNIHECM